MSIDPMMALSARRLHELQDEARRQALVRLATCCRPSAARARLQALAARVRAALVREEPCCA